LLKMKVKKSAERNSLQTVKVRMKFRYRETGENWNGPTMLRGVDVACYIVNYIGHVVFSVLSNKSILSSISPDWIYALSVVAPQGSQQSRGYTQSTVKFDTSDLFC